MDGDLPRAAGARRRRDPARGQGSLRHGRARDDVRLGDLRRPRAARDGRGGAAGSRRRATRTSARRTCTSSPTAITSQNPHFGTVPNPLAPGRLAGGSSGGSAAALAAGPRRRRARHRLAAARSGSRPPGAASSASSRRTGSSRSTAASRSRRASTTPGRWRARSRTARTLLRALVPGFEPRAGSSSLEDCASASPGRERADPLVRARVEEAAARVPARACRSSCPSPDGDPTLHARGRRRPPRALRRARRPVRRERPARRSSAASRHRRRGGDAPRGARERYRERSTRSDGRRRPARSTPTLAVRRAAAPTSTSSTSASAAIRLTYPVQRARLAGARAARAAPAEDGLPASLQLVGRPGDDALVLAAGALALGSLARSSQA